MQNLFCRCARSTCDVIIRQGPLPGMGLNTVLHAVWLGGGLTICLAGWKLED